MSPSISQGCAGLVADDWWGGRRESFHGFRSSPFVMSLNLYASARRSARPPVVPCWMGLEIRCLSSSLFKTGRFRMGQQPSLEMATWHFAVAMSSQRMPIQLRRATSASFAICMSANQRALARAFTTIWLAGATWMCMPMRNTSSTCISWSTLARRTSLTSSRHR